MDWKEVSSEIFDDLCWNLIYLIINNLEVGVKYKNGENLEMERVNGNKMAV